MSASQIKLVQMGICQVHAFNDLMKQKKIAVHSKQVFGKVLWWCYGICFERQ